MGMFVQDSDSTSQLGKLDLQSSGWTASAGGLERGGDPSHTVNSMPNRISRCTQSLGVALLACLLVGCERRSIEVYTVENESVENRGAPGVAEPAVRLPGPPGDSWHPIDPAGGPRLASFKIVGSVTADEVADMGVTVFPGAAGGLLANVNRWRNEMAQPPLGEVDLAGALSEIEVGGYTIHLVDAASPERRTLGGILPLASETWFFKLTGPVAIVSEQEAPFLNYLRGLEIRDNPKTRPEVEDAAPERPRLTYKTPAGWIEGEPTVMRAASFSVSGDGDGREADISVIPLGGSGGAQLAIVNQWRATLRLDDASADQLPGMMERLEVGGHSYQIANLESEVAMLGGDRKARILVAFTTVGDHSWFFKIAGDSSLVAEQRPVLLEFLNSVEFPIQ